jgi:hypothetical protein
MSRRAIALVIVFLGALVVANIIVLAIWLPNRKNTAAKAQPPNLTPVAPAAVSNASPATAPPPAAPGHPNDGAVGFALERQVTSVSGNLRIKYLRDSKTKIRRIAVEDVHRPGGSAVLCESKRSAWALISPDDQWIVVDDRGATDGGGARLYRRNSDASIPFVLAQETGAPSLQDMVWKAYLNATRADPNTPRRGVTIDATGWENDSRKLDVSVAYLPTRDNPDVPEPWSCTYDVASKQVEPVSAPTANQDGDQSAQEQASEEEMAAGNRVAENGESPAAETGDDADLPGEKFPATRLDELAVPDVNESSVSDITYAINEMFARHGAEFKDKKVTKQFEQFSWYTPRPGLSFDEIETEFSDLEKQNLKVLGRCRDAKLAAARRKSSPVRGQRVQEESTDEKILRGIRTWQDLGAPMPPHP